MTLEIIEKHIFKTLYEIDSLKLPLSANAISWMQLELFWLGALKKKIKEKTRPTSLHADAHITHVFNIVGSCRSLIYK